MGSLRIANVPTLVDLAVRLAGRKNRNAITGHTIVQAYTALKAFAGNDDVQNLFPDLDEIYSDELHQLGLPEEKISPKIKECKKQLFKDPIFDFPEYQQFEFDLVEEEPDLRNIRKFLEILKPEKLNINNAPMLRCVFDYSLRTAFDRLKLSQGEKNKLGNYVHNREEVIRENSCPVTNKNKIVLSNDIWEISELSDWAPVRVVINGLEDPEEVSEELVCAYESILGGATDYVRIESAPQSDQIAIGYYSKFFVR